MKRVIIITVIILVLFTSITFSGGRMTQQELVDICLVNKLYHEAGLLCQYQAAQALRVDKELLDIIDAFVKLKIKEAKEKQGI